MRAAAGGDGCGVHAYRRRRQEQDVREIHQQFCPVHVGVVFQPDALKQQFEGVEVIIDVQAAAVRGERHDPVHAVADVHAKPVA